MKRWRRRWIGCSEIWENSIEGVGDSKFKGHLALRGQGTASSKGTCNVRSKARSL